MKPSHELTKNHHEYVPAQPAPDPLKSTGYVEREYEHQEYPKVLDNCSDADGKPVTARDEEHEEQLRADHKRRTAKKEEPKQEESKA